MFLPNEAEALAISGESELGQAARVLAAAGRNVVIKLGARGALCVSAGSADPCLVAVPQVLPVDSNAGAGDCLLQRRMSSWACCTATWTCAARWRARLRGRRGIDRRARRNRQPVNRSSDRYAPGRCRDDQRTALAGRLARALGVARTDECAAVPPAKVTGRRLGWGGLAGEGAMLLPQLPFATGRTR